MEKTSVTFTFPALLCKQADRIGQNVA